MNTTTSMPRWNQLPRSERLVVVGSILTALAGLIGVIIGEYRFSGSAAWVLALPPLVIGLMFLRAMNPLGRWLAAETLAATAAGATLALALVNGLQLLRADRSSLAFGGWLALVDVAVVVVGAIAMSIGAVQLGGPAVSRTNLEMPALARLDRPRVIFAAGGTLVVAAWALMVTVGAFSLDFGGASAIVLGVAAVSWGIRRPMSLIPWIVVAATLAAYLTAIAIGTVADAGGSGLGGAENLAPLALFVVSVGVMIAAVVLAAIGPRAHAAATP